MLQELGMAEPLEGREELEVLDPVEGMAAVDG